MVVLASAGCFDLFAVPGVQVSPDGNTVYFLTGANVSMDSMAGTSLSSVGIGGGQPTALTTGSQTDLTSAFAVNPTNGDLAVTDIFGFSGAGGIELYANASGSPTRISNPAQYEYYFDGYDSNGNLFADGWSYPSFTFTISEIPAGSGSMNTVSISGGTPVFPGMVQWYRNGNYLAVGDQECGFSAASCVYWYAISGSTATYTGVTDLSSYLGGPVTDMVQGVIAANNEKYLAGGDAGGGTVNRFMWDAGGSPTNYNNSTVVEPIGAAISTK